MRITKYFKHGMNLKSILDHFFTINHLIIFCGLQHSESHERNLKCQNTTHVRLLKKRYVEACIVLSVQ